MIKSATLKRAAAIATTALALVLGASLSQTATALVDPQRETTIVELPVIWAGNETTSEVDFNLLGDLGRIVPGDKGETVLRITNFATNPSPAYLTVQIVGKELFHVDHDAVDNIYDHLLVNGTPVSEIAGYIENNGEGWPVGIEDPNGAVPANPDVGARAVAPGLLLPLGQAVNVPFIWELPLAYDAETHGNVGTLPLPDGAELGVEFAVRVSLVPQPGGVVVTPPVVVPPLPSPSPSPAPPTPTPTPTPVPPTPTPVPPSPSPTPTAPPAQAAPGAVPTRPPACIMWPLIGAGLLGAGAWLAASRRRQRDAEAAA